MKTLLVLIVGAVLGILGYQYYLRTQHPTLGQRAHDATVSTRESASDLKDRVVEGSRTVGEKVDDARIITAIKGKFVLDKDLSARAISVSCSDGHVTLHGAVKTVDLIDRAVALARDTSGVTVVKSELVVGS